MRAFLGLEVPESSRHVLSSVRGKLDDIGLDTGSLRWTKPDNLHLTVRFLGEIDTNVCDLLVSRLRRSLHASGPVAVSIERVVWFPSRRPSVLAAQVVSTERLLTLFASVESEVRDIGLPAEDRGPHPHITLARTRRRGARPAIPIDEALTLEYTCRELVMFESDLRSTGVRYMRYGEISLEGAPFMPQS